MVGKLSARQLIDNHHLAPVSSYGVRHPDVDVMVILNVKQGVTWAF